MRLRNKRAVGRPSFGLNEDQLATVIDLICRGARLARREVQSGELEPSINIRVRKGMVRAKQRLGLTNLEVRGEHEVDDPWTTDPAILGRIDIQLKFSDQFGTEADYVAVECKRVGAGRPELNTRYVDQGVKRFASGRYARDHQFGFMLGYVLAEPAQEPVQRISEKVVQQFGQPAALTPEATVAAARALLSGRIPRRAGGPITLYHVFVSMLPAR